MAKMTRAQARRRLNEAAGKVMKVHMAAMEGKLGAVPLADIKKLFPVALDLRRISEKLK